MPFRASIQYSFMLGKYFLNINYGSYNSASVHLEVLGLLLKLPEGLRVQAATAGRGGWMWIRHTDGHLIRQLYDHLIGNNRIQFSQTETTITLHWINQHSSHVSFLQHSLLCVWVYQKFLIVCSIWNNLVINTPGLRSVV